MRGRSFPAKIAYRYLSSKRNEAFISILTFISTGALALGVAVLIIVMSIMNGFEYELKSKLLGTNAHITVRSVSGTLFGWRELETSLRGVSEVSSVSPYAYHQALLQNNKRSSGVLIRGILEESAAGKELSDKVVSQNDSKKLFSARESDLPGIVIGKELARSLRLAQGDVITLLSPQVHSSPFGLMPRYRRFEISGIYSSGLTEYENSLAYIDLSIAQQFFRLGSAVSGFEIRLTKLDRANVVAPKITELLVARNAGAYAEPWTETHKGLWEALRLERTVYFIVLLLLVVMASFSIVSTLVMLVLEKRKDIAVLRTLGATKGEVAAIFRSSGMIIGLLGTFLGLLLGVGGAIALRKYGFPLPEGVFPVATVPVRLDLLVCAFTAFVALCICFLATIYPARRASSLHPTELLRYE